MHQWAVEQVQTWKDASESAFQAGGRAGLMMQAQQVFRRERELYLKLAEVTQAGFGEWSDARLAEVGAALQAIGDLAETGDVLIAGTPAAATVLALKESDQEAFAISSILGSSDELNNSYRLRIAAGGTGLSPRALVKAGAARYPMANLDPTPEDIAHARKLRDEWQSELTELRAQGRLVKAQAEAVKSIEKTYRDGLQLHASVKYWNDRARKAFVAARQSGLAFALLLAIYLMFAINIIAPLVANMQANSALVEIALVTLPSLAFFWGMKLVARIYVQSVARNGDANERATLIQAYLALGVDTTTPPSPEERLLLIRAICRPGPGDPVEEAPQDAILDQLLKRVSGG